MQKLIKKTLTLSLNRNQLHTAILSYQIDIKYPKFALQSMQRNQVMIKLCMKILWLILYYLSIF